MRSPRKLCAPACVSALCLVLFVFGVAFFAVMFRSSRCIGYAALFATSYGIGPTISDVRALAEGASAVADIYLHAAKSAPSISDSLDEIDLHDAAAVHGLQAVAAQQDRQQSNDATSAGGRCPLCSREYSAPCPESWVDVGGGVCEAPPAYDGACLAYGAFSGLSTADKHEFERRCAACWPCASNVAQETTAAGFLRFARANDVGVATVRLVEPEDALPNAAHDLHIALVDALEAVEGRQRVDESAYAALLASSGALAQAAGVADTRAAS